MPHKSESPARVLLIVTGGIAAYKACDVLRELRRAGAEVQVIMTRGAQEFVRPLTFEALSGRRVGTELFPGVTEGAIDHISLARFADLALVVPATADFLARLYAGRADDLAAAALLALDPSVKTLLVPAMNTQMWEHPATRRNVAGLRELCADRCEVMEPVVKELACGEYGGGGLPEPAAIAERALELLSRR